MTGRLLVVPSGDRIFGRSVGYGVAAGAAAGAIVPLGLGIILSLAARDAGAFALGLIVGAPIGAAVGAVAGLACGLTAGLGLVVFRRHIAGSRCAIRAVAAIGAGLLPATWLVALAAGSGPRFLSVPTALTAVIVALASGLGVRAFYGKPRVAKAHAHATPSRGGSNA